MIRCISGEACFSGGERGGCQKTKARDSAGGLGRITARFASFFAKSPPRATPVVSVWPDSNSGSRLSTSQNGKRLKHALFFLNMGGSCSDITRPILGDSVLRVAST